MSQQKPIENGAPFQSAENHIRRLFVQTGFGYKEIANSRGVYIDEINVRNYIARIVEEYSPPSPSIKLAEQKIIDGPSKIHTGGKSSYKITLRLIFPNKLVLNDFMFFLGNEFKFYDERGGIYTGAVMDSPDIKMVEAGQRYDVKVNLLCVKKEAKEEELKIHFTDIGKIEGKILKCFTNNSSGTIELNFLALNKIQTIDIPYGSTDEVMAQTVAANLKYYGFEEYFTIRVSGNNVHLAPVNEYVVGSIIFFSMKTNMLIYGHVAQVDHWAKEHIMNCASIGITTQYDSNGNMVYVFSPNAYITRAQASTFLNRLRKYVERMIRG